MQGAQAAPFLPQPELTLPGSHPASPTHPVQAPVWHAPEAQICPEPQTLHVAECSPHAPEAVPATH